MNDLLYTLETLTAEARSSSAGTTQKAAAMDARQIAIRHLCELIKHGTVLSAAEYERVRVIEKEGDEMLKAARKNRQELLDKLNITARQHSFAKAVESTLDLPRRIGISA